MEYQDHNLPSFNKAVQSAKAAYDSATKSARAAYLKAVSYTHLYMDGHVPHIPMIMKIE